MRELRESNRHYCRRENAFAHAPQIGQRFLQNLLVVEAGNDDHLAMELYSAFGKARELSLDVRHPRVVEEDLSRLVIRRVHGDVEWGEPVL